MHTPRVVTRPGLAALLLSILAAACGGGVEMEEGSTDGPAATVISPLFADDGSVMPSAPSLTPADPGARTRAAHYASESQPRQLEFALADSAIRTDVDTATAELAAVEVAVFLALRQQAAHRLDFGAPVLVRGRDLRLAAAAADRLADIGFGAVFVVTR